LVAVIGLIVVSLHKKANELKEAFVILSAILGIYNMLLIAIVVVYVVFNYIIPENIPPAAVLTR
jgi:hypothetical protein